MIPDRDLYDASFDDIVSVDMDAFAYSRSKPLATDGVYCCIATGIQTEQGHLLTHTPPDLDEKAPYLEAVTSIFETPIEGTALHIVGPHTDEDDLDIVQDTIASIDGLEVEEYVIETEAPGSLAIDTETFYRYDPSIRFDGSYEI